MTQLYAQPYDIFATGFYFESQEEYIDRAKRNLNDLGFPVEEYEIQFIDGTNIDATLFNALNVHQAKPIATLQHSHGARLERLNWLYSS